jgi:hypothetical protein
MYPEGLIMGIKQPFMTISYEGNIILRNDNSSNITFKPLESIVLQNNINFNLLDHFQHLKENAYKFFRKGSFKASLRCLELAQVIVHSKNDSKLQLYLYQNMAECYMRLNLYEDVLEQCDLAL